MLATIESAPVESPLVSVEIVPKRKFAPFNRDNAVEMARRSAIVRAANKAERERQRLEPANLPADVPDYVKERIVRTRRHIERLDGRLDKAIDPQEIKWLADSIAKLQDVERVLSGRPAPAPFKQSRRGSSRDTFTPPAPVD